MQLKGWGGVGVGTERVLGDGGWGLEGLSMKVMAEVKLWSRGGPGLHMKGKEGA